MFCRSTDKIDFNAPPIPAKPRNQNEAMAVAATVPEAAIEEVITITYTDRDTAIRYLKVRNNDPERAVNAILDGEDISKDEKALAWDDSAFAKDRDGVSGESRLRPLGISAAPTRGPSPAGSFRTPANKEEEDGDLARALAMSQQDLGLQETGVVGADGSTKPAFGPANRSQYDPSEWAMVSTQHNSREVVPDVDAQERRHKSPEPRFLKHLPEGDYLPNFLTICHAIPAAREALLLRDHVQGNYGSHYDWWRGDAIKLATVVHVQSGAPADQQMDEYDALIAETQRLMAFLDSSERSYASAHSLAMTECLQKQYSGRYLVSTFMHEFAQAAQARAGQLAKLMQVFATNVGNTADEGIAEPYRYLVDLSSSIAKDTSCNLIELIDDMLWTNGRDPFSTNDNFIHQAADVLVIRVQNTDFNANRTGVKVPAVLWLDKYLEKNVDVSKAVRMHAVDQRQRVANIDDVIKKLSTRQHPTKSTEVDAKALMQHTLGRFRKMVLTRTSSKDGDEDAPIVNGMGQRDIPHYPDVVKKLEVLSSSIDQKIARLTEQKTALLKCISELSNSTPDKLLEAGLEERYTLMGVATKSSVTYVLRPSDDKLDERMSPEDTEESTPAGMQWWRIAYVVNGTSPSIQMDKQTQDDVLDAVEREHSSALLVYASDAAADFDNHNAVLPEPLQRFIYDDNELFEKEIRNIQTRRSEPPQYDINLDGGVPRLSIERSDSAGSGNSMAVNDDGEGLAYKAYSDDHTILAQANYGLPPDLPPIDIELSPRSDEDEELAGMETVEKTHAPHLFQQSGVDDLDMDADDGRGREHVNAQGDVDKMSFIEHGESLN